MKQIPTLRIARPVSDLAASVAMYRAGLGVHVIGSFENHDGFDGVMLGTPGAPYHFEFTVCRTHPVAPAPTPEDLIVLYVPDEADWRERCEAMTLVGFRSVKSFNPYWEQCGRTFEDADGYRIVIQQAAWSD